MTAVMPDSEPFECCSTSEQHHLASADVRSYAVIGGRPSLTDEDDDELSVARSCRPIAPHAFDLLEQGVS
jgi:hypothetical protein